MSLIIYEGKTPDYMPDTKKGKEYQAKLDRFVELHYSDFAELKLIKEYDRQAQAHGWPMHNEFQNNTKLFAQLVKFVIEGIEVEDYDEESEEKSEDDEEEENEENEMEDEEDEEEYEYFFYDDEECDC